jgi:hypothetical protein
MASRPDHRQADITQFVRFGFRNLGHQAACGGGMPDRNDDLFLEVDEVLTDQDWSDFSVRQDEIALRPGITQRRHAEVVGKIF